MGAYRRLTRGRLVDSLGQGHDDSLRPAHVGHARHLLVLTDAADQAVPIPAIRSTTAWRFSTSNITLRSPSSLDMAAGDPGSNGPEWCGAAPARLERFALRRRLVVASSECAWQESNLLPFGPEPNALSGELQARERFSLDCGVRGQTCRPRGCSGSRRRMPEHPAGGTDPNAQSITSHRRRRRGAPAG